MQQARAAADASPRQQDEGSPAEPSDPTDEVHILECLANSTVYIQQWHLCAMAAMSAM